MLTKIITTIKCIKNFDESDYLLANPDVATAINNGTFSSGFKHYIKHGLKEGRTLRITKNRNEIIFGDIDKHGSGLEIGPSHNPIAPKKEGYNVKIVDHASADDLKKKYLGHSINLENIEEVDFISSGEPLSELVKGEKFDWIIASHVIEHIPNLIEFLQQAQASLKPDGILSLVVPDKRFCFDYLMPLTTTGHLLEAFQEQRKKPSPGQIFDFYGNACKKNDAIAWGDGEKGNFTLAHEANAGSQLWKKSLSSTEYMDVHCWRFIPESFKLILSDLLELGLISLTISSQHPTIGCEFYISLKNQGEKPFAADSRLDLLMAIHREEYSYPQVGNAKD